MMVCRSAAWCAVLLLIMPIDLAADDTSVVRLGMRLDAAPFSSRLSDAANTAPFYDAYQGFSVSLCVKIVETLRETDPDLRIEAVGVTAQTRFPSPEHQAEDWTLLCDPTSVTVARLEYCSFSFPYFVTGIAYATLDSKMTPATLRDQIVALVGQTTADTGLEAEWVQKYGDAPKFEPKSNYEEAVAALRDNKVAAVFGDQVLLMEALETAGMVAEYTLSSDVLSIELYSFCVDPDRPEVLAAVNATLADLYRTGEVIELLADNFDGRGANRLLSTMYRLYAVSER